ncbi:MAG: 2-C-methyl-D-erythritol 2,4-cyclodiphosphate synthase [Proteobacteria bacterium]|nr:2-C-methyl-D-erythritol 2,4-cyclodiphosphate synthase [Pseudomonadota bacterium]
MLNTVTGIGYDSHRFMAGRKLILGGVDIPCDMGLDGHSDADALCHAIIDGILGAAGKKDIGQIFPDTDPKWKDADSLGLLKKTTELISKDKIKIIYIDAVVVTEKPKIASHINKMIEKISEATDINSKRINIKAKTNEKMGFSGREEGLMAMACVTIERDFNDR